jgi:hypothetical protein
MEQSEKTQLQLLIATATAGLICVLFACSLFCYYDSLKKAIDVIDASADFLAGTKRVIVVPGIFLALSLIAITAWTGSMVCVVSLNEIYASEYIP